MADKHVTVGDLHEGHAVELIEKDGRSFIRKPRSASIERALDAFLLELKAEGFTLAPSCVKILREDGESHDEELVLNLHASSEDDIHLYFKRSGALIFLAYLFSSSDLHYENIISRVDSPVLIDVETLLNGEIPVRGTASPSSLANSVLKSHLLPNWEPIADGRFADCGGLTAVRDDGKNILYFDGSPCYAYMYEQDIQEGFADAYSFAISHREQISAQLSVFSDCFFRKLLRPTAVYGALVDYVKKLGADNARPAIEELLQRAYKSDIDSFRADKTAAVFRAEVESVLRGDIPIFFNKGDALVLFAGGQALQEDFLSLSPVDSARKRLFSLDSDDFTAQKRIISQSLAAIRPIDGDGDGAAIFSNKSVRTDSHPHSTLPEDIIYGTLEALEAAAIPRLSSVWMRLETAHDGCPYLQSSGLGLYDGLLGILCFYAAGYRKTRDGEFLRLLLGHYDSYLDAMTETGEIKINSPSVFSLQYGLSGHIAALLHISELTGLERFRLDAQRLASRLSAELDSVDSFDLLCGISGLAVQLPKLPLQTSFPLAQAIAAQLAACPPPRLTGAAHGVSGTALAIGALRTVLGEKGFDKSIYEMLQYEDSYFDEAEINWQDLRDASKKGFMSGWCSGAPGIGMTRQRLMSYSDDGNVLDLCRSGIRRAERKLLSLEPSRRLSLCCGAAARLMCSGALGIQLPRELEALCNRAATDGAHYYHPIDTADKSFGLMQGISGVAYAVAMYGDPLSGGMLL